MICLPTLAVMTETGRERLARVAYAIAIATLKHLNDAGKSGFISQPSFDRLVYEGKGSRGMLMKACLALDLPIEALQAVLDGDLTKILGMDFGRNPRARQIILDVMAGSSPPTARSGLFSNEI